MAAGPEDVAPALDALYASVRAAEADALYLRHVETGSAAHRWAAEAPGRLCRRRRGQEAVHWVAELPPSSEALLASLTAKQRENLRRTKRLLDGELADWEIVVRSDWRDLTLLEGEIAHVASRSYQQAVRAEPGDEPLQRELIRLGLEKDWYRAYVMYIGGEPAAYWTGFQYRGSFGWGGETAFDPRYSRFGIGTFLLVHMLGDLCEHHGVRTLNFGFGDADYKRLYATRSWREEDVLVAAPTFKGIRTSLTRTGVLAINGIAGRAAGGERGRRVKRLWRSRLAPKAVNRDDRSSP
jgi:hypothetical protein